MLSNCESTTSQYYVMYGAAAEAMFFSGSGKKVLKSRLRLHNAVKKGALSTKKIIRLRREPNGSRYCESPEVKSERGRLRHRYVCNGTGTGYNVFVFVYLLT